MKPSPWIVRWSHLLTPGATVLDIACGGGRHLTWFSARNHAVTGVDRDINQARLCAPSADLVCADIENNPWPFQTDGALRTFGAVVVTNYLWRPLLETVVASVAPGGVLLYETFAAGNETIGRPARPDFLLQPKELLQACTTLEVVAYENGYLQDPPRFVQRIAAIRARTGHPGQPEIQRLAL